MRYALLLAFLFSALNAQAAAPGISSVGGVSNFISTAPATAYGGMAGDLSSCAQDGASVCDTCIAAGVNTTANNCTTAPLCQCNTAAIYNGLTVRVNLSNEAAVTSGQGCAASPAAGNVGTKVALTKVTTNNDYSFVDFHWRDICTNIGNADCALIGTANTLTVDLWVAATGHGCSTAPAPGDSEVSTLIFKVVNPFVITTGGWNVYGTPAEGIYNFRPYPGDSKIYLENLQSTSGFPSLGTATQAEKVVVFSSPNSIDDANYQAPPLTPAQLPIVDNGDTLERNIVDNLDNYTRYYFRIAILDSANNVVQYFPGTDGGDANCKAGGDGTLCPYSAVPSEVLGLLSKDVNCFVATAAYGSAMEPKIQTFRDFRHEFLLTNHYGLAFVRAYNEFGPKAALFISDKPYLRTAVRGILWPLWGFSYLALKVGFAYAFAASLLLIAFFISAPVVGLRRYFTK